jgi:tRNA (cmo5U34)-methyltransferase
LKYLARADGIPHRTEGEAVLLEFVPKNVRRILDLGTGDGRLLALLRIDRPDAERVALDFSPTMLAAARERFRGENKVQVIEHNLGEPLPELGQFDVIVSSFAIDQSPRFAMTFSLSKRRDLLHGYSICQV